MGDLWPEGQVKVNGEIWRARCDGGCDAGQLGRRPRHRRVSRSRSSPPDVKLGAVRRFVVPSHPSCCVAHRRRAVRARMGVESRRCRSRAPSSPPPTSEARSWCSAASRSIGGASPRVDAYSPARDSLATPSRPPGRRPPRHGGRERADGSTCWVAIRRGRAAAGRVRPRERSLARASAHAVRARGCRCRGGRGGKIVVAGGVTTRGDEARTECALFDLAHAALVRRSRADAARAPRRDGACRNGVRRRRPHGGARHEPPHLRELPARAIGRGGGCSRCPTRAAEPEPRRSPGTSYRSAARSPLGRSRRFSHTVSPTGAGFGCRTCRRRGTALASPRSAAASS